MKNYNRSLLVLKYLHDKTDEDHLVTIKDINDCLKEEQLDADRETVADCIKELQEAGYDIVCVRSTQNRYYMRSRPFTLAEVKLLVDAVQSSRFISEQQSREIVEKLSTLVGSYKADILKRHLYIGSRVKPENPNLTEYIETIHNAVTKNKKIEFRYFDYNAEKQKNLRRDGKVYHLSPFDLIWNNDMYYVVGVGNHNDTLLKYRLDRMQELEMTDEDRREVPEGYNIADFFEKEFSMMTGNVSTVELLCENKLMGSIIDKFGTNVQTEVIDPEHFKATVLVELSGVFFGWVIASRGMMKIVGPEEVVSQFQNIIRQYLSENT